MIDSSEFGRMKFAVEAAGIALWTWNIDSDRITLDDRAFDMWGIPRAPSVTFEDLSAKIHPADLDKVRAAFAATRERLGAYETDFRILYGRDVRWISARGKTEVDTVANRVLNGVFMDVTVRKMAEEAREMMAGELHHRMKNLFALASSLTSLSARKTSSKEEMTKDLTQRLKALSEAHGMIQPGMGQQSPARDLAQLLEVLLKPYSHAETEDHRVEISLPELLVGERSATTIALIVHELATNSMKYGAFSSPGGRVEITGEDSEGKILIKWQELGGPSVISPPASRGFGQRLITATIEGQLGGTITVDWASEGIVVLMRVNKVLLGA